MLLDYGLKSNSTDKEIEDYTKTQIDEFFNKDNFIFDLESDDLKEFEGKEEFEKYAGQRRPDVLREFSDHYKEYWNGWRFWFLP